ncbi:MAG: hypothetical protein ABEI52_10110 [Halobacteriaceae archaeon]
MDSRKLTVGTIFVFAGGIAIGLGSSKVITDALLGAGVAATIAHRAGLAFATAFPPLSFLALHLMIPTREPFGRVALVGGAIGIAGAILLLLTLPAGWTGALAGLSRPAIGLVAVGVTLLVWSITGSIVAAGPTRETDVAWVADKRSNNPAPSASTADGGEDDEDDLTFFDEDEE